MNRGERKSTGQHFGSRASKNSTHPKENHKISNLERKDNNTHNTEKHRSTEKQGKGRIQMYFKVKRKVIEKEQENHAHHKSTCGDDRFDMLQ